jgi:hypothetical protein
MSAAAEMRGQAFFVIRLQAERLGHLPDVGRHSADPKVYLMCVRSIRTSSHPTALASQVAWITGERQFSRLER